MAFQDKSKANYSFKVLLGRTHTGNDKELANESIPSNPVLAAQNIWADVINPIPSDGSNVGIVSDLVVLELEALANGISYVAKLGAAVPASLAGQTNPLTNAIYAPFDRVGHIIPDKFGTGFRPILKDNGTEVPPLDSSDWFLDPFAGVIVQENDGDSPSLGLGTTGTIECYIYIGNFVSDSTSDSSIISGVEMLDTNSSVYIIGHPAVPGIPVPVVSLVAPTSADAIFGYHLVNIQNNQFTVVLSDTPEVTGYKLNWINAPQ